MSYLEKLHKLSHTGTLKLDTVPQIGGGYLLLIELSGCKVEESGSGKTFEEAFDDLCGKLNFKDRD